MITFDKTTTASIFIADKDGDMLTVFTDSTNAPDEAIEFDLDGNRLFLTAAEAYEFAYKLMELAAVAPAELPPVAEYTADYQTKYQANRLTDFTINNPGQAQSPWAYLTL